MPAKTPRPITAEQAASLVQSGMWLDYGFSHNQPDVFDRALAARAGELKDVKIRSCFTLRPRAVLDADPTGESFHWFSWHFSSYDRRCHDAGRCCYMPINLGEAADYYRRFIDPVDIVILKSCPLDDGGYFNFGPTSVWHRALVERAKTVIVETAAGMPWVHGDRCGIHKSEVDYIVEGDHQPLVAIQNPAPTDVDRAVANRIAAEIDEGACLQIGVGAMPNAVCSLLLEGGVKNLSIHTEMMIDGIADLYRAGLITGTGKKVHPGKLAYTFAVGSSELYATLDRNPDFLCCPSEFTNSPDIIRQNDRVVSINNTTQIDLQGQAASESDGHRHISGTGGQLQFVRGAYLSEGGKSFICLSSTYDKKGERRSRIVLNLTPGNIVTTPRTDVMYVVTEYGMVCLKARSVAERARLLISIAHPDFREDLERQAHTHGLIPRNLCC